MSTEEKASIVTSGGKNTNLELEIVDAQYEIHQTDLQLKLLQDEEPAALTNLSDVFSRSKSVY